MPRLGQAAPVADRFFSKVAKAAGDGCWLWTAGKDKDGYGKFQINVPGQRKQIHVRAHQFSFELAFGRKPILLRHRCDTPACVRPDHLLEGTQSDNRNDSVERGREPHGETKPNALLTDAIVMEAKALPKRRGTLAQFARSRGVPLGPLWSAVSGRAWRHLCG